MKLKNTDLRGALVLLGVLFLLFLTWDIWAVATDSVSKDHLVGLIPVVLLAFILIVMRIDGYFGPLEDPGPLGESDPE
ncbi:MAG: hypothetical protein AAB431_01460 [Patescibacteria group bacterium]